VSREHSLALTGIPGAVVGTFSSPTAFSENVVWQNRQFYFWVDADSGCTPGDPGCTSTYGLCPDVSGALACPGGNNIVYDDLSVIAPSVIESPACLNPTYSVLTNLAEDASKVDEPVCSYNAGSNNLAGDPMFISEYFNGARSAVLQTEINTGIQTPAAFDEGGNFIRPKFGPLSLYDDVTTPDGDPGTLFGDYHIESGSSARGAASKGVSPDFDEDDRPQGGYDIGADEIF
jgi:hypothetical protein